MEKKHKIRLTLSSYDPQQLEKATKQVASTAKRTGSEVVGPVPLPNRKRTWTVLRSPHVDKKSRDQFELKRHRRLLDIIEPKPETVSALMNLSISAGVHVEIK